MIDPTTNSDLETGGATVSSTPLARDSSTGPDAATATGMSSGNGQGRIHRFAGTMHRAIDSIEQRLGATAGGMSSTRARYGEQAQHYRARLGNRMSEHPLRSTGVVLAAGVLIDRLFLRKSKVRVVEVPERRRWMRQDSPRSERRLERWSDAADAHLQRVGRAGRHAADRAGMAAALGAAGTTAAVSGLASRAGALPLQMRLATQRLMARSQEYGSMARSTVVAHPWAGLGAVLAASGLLTTAVMRRRGPAAEDYATSDQRTSDLGWSGDGYETQPGLGGMISSRPVTSAVVVLGLGVLAGALLRRRMD